jgi:hypothetical protein
VSVTLKPLSAFVVTERSCAATDEVPTDKEPNAMAVAVVEVDVVSPFTDELEATPAMVKVRLVLMIPVIVTALIIATRVSPESVIVPLIRTIYEPGEDGFVTLLLLSVITFAPGGIESPAPHVVNMIVSGVIVTVASSVGPPVQEFTLVNPVTFMSFAVRVVRSKARVVGSKVMTVVDPEVIVFVVV